MAATNIEINPKIKSFISLLNVLETKWTTAIWMSVKNPTEVLISASGEKYRLEFGISNGEAYLERNGCVVRAPLADKPDKPGACMVAAVVSPISLQIYINDGKSNGPLTTDFTIPPNSLITWARNQARIPVKTYASDNDFRHEIINAISILEDLIRKTNSYEAFWDTEYKGKTITKRTPKAEPHTQPTVLALLHNYFLTKGINVEREVVLANGQLDFLFSGISNEGEMIFACMEYKNAHHPDLVHGLTVQLPVYMRAKGTDLGFFCIVWFKGDRFDKPKVEKSELMLQLEVAASNAGCSHIVSRAVDLSIPAPPSKL